MPVTTGMLGDTAARDYARKLQLFNAFAAPEIKRAIASLELAPASRVLDAGCGTGEALAWIATALGSEGRVVGLDLAAAHTRCARALAPAHIGVVQGDLMKTPFADATFDLVWGVNSFNHLHDPVAGIRQLSRLLRAGGRIAVGQSALLPDMYFAWDARLERAVTVAVQRYYQDRYRLADTDLTGVRGVVGWLVQAGLRDVSARTVVIERLAPLDAATERYLAEAIFRDTWGERLRPYLSAEDHSLLSRLCDPRAREFALMRADFHFLQTFTVATARVP